MKILFLNPTGQIGGAEVVLLNLFKQIKRIKPEWQLYLVTGSEGALCLKARQLGVHAEIMSYPVYLANLGEYGGGIFKFLIQAWRAIPDIFRYISFLKKKIREFQPDIIHANGLKPSLLAGLVKSNPEGLIWHIHDYISERKWTSFAMKALQSKVDRILAVSESVAADIKKTLGDQTKVYVLRNTVDLDQFSPEGPKADLDQLAGLERAPANLVRIGMLGTMAKWKGHEVFLKAISLLPKELPMRAYIIGAPIYQTKGSQYSIEELKAIASTYGISDRVGFTGYIEDAASALRALDIVVHASTKPEPFGLVIIEAMACGKPIIASKAGGPEEIIAEGEDGLFYLPQNGIGLSKAISRIVNDNNLQKSFKNAGLLTVHSKYSVNSNSDTLAAIYEEIHQITTA